ncbi:WD40 repeat domain-containing protein [Streptacidiphilus sp. EB129]|uniref:WD40 repeat domain-containing protein n=1 Tax=Streptacidiphilus sp. EB129 TaxID=3156262 RepID=UPI0035147547
MRLTDADPGTVLAHIRAVSRTMAAGTDPDLGPFQLCAMLCDQGWWIAACRAAVLTDDPWLDAATPASGPAPDAGPRDEAGLALHLIQQERPEAFGRACAVLHAARAVRARRTHRTEERRQLLLAALSWSSGGPQDGEPQDAEPQDAEPRELPVNPGALTAESPLTDLEAGHPDLPWQAVRHLVHHLEHGPHAAHGSIQSPILLGSPTPSALGTLVLEAVTDPDEQLLPDLSSMLFSDGLDAMSALLRPAFDWIRAQEQFPRGHGARWALLHPGGRPVTTLPPAHPAAAAAVALGRLFPPRPLRLTPIGWAVGDADPRVVIHADITPVGALRSIGPAAAAALPGSALRTSHVLLVATADRPAAVEGSTVEGSAAGGTAARRPRVRAAGSVRKAVRRSRRLSRATRWAAGVAVTLLVLAGAGLGAADHFSRQADQHQIGVNAEAFSGQALQDAVDSPDQAVLAALTAQALAPGSTSSRSALLSVVNRDLRIRHLLPPRSAHVEAIAVDQQAHYTAVLGTDHHLHVWNVPTQTEVPLPTTLATDVRAIAFPAAGGPLAVAVSTGILLWDPASPDTPARRIAEVADPRALALSSDGLTMAWSTGDGDLGAQDVRTATTPRVLRAGNQPARALAVTPSGDTVAFSGADGRLALWRWNSSGTPSAVRTDLPPMDSLTFAGPHLYAAGATRLYALDAGTARNLASPAPVPVDTTVTYRPQAHRLLVAVDNAVKEVADDPAALGTTDGAPTNGTDLVAYGTHVGSIVALSGDDQSAAVPTADGSVLLYSAPSAPVIDTTVQVGFIKATYPVPGTSTLLYVSTLSTTGSVTVYDTARGSAHLTRVTVDGAQTAIYGSSYSARQSTLALATRSGRILLYPFRNGALGSPVVIDGPAGQVARGALFDDTTGELVCLWSHMLAVYSTPAQGSAQPVPLYRTTITDAASSEALSSVGGYLFIGGSQGLYALARHQAGYDWTGRTTLTSRYILTVQPLPDGSAVAMSFSGGISLYRHTQGAIWAETTVAGHGSTTDALIVGDDFIGSAGFTQVRLFDSTTGRPLVTVNYGDLFSTSAWYGAPVLHVNGDVAGVGADIPVGQDELNRRACALAGPSTGTVNALWPAAPTSVRDRTLCPARN